MRILDQLWRIVVYLAILAWAGGVAYSRYIFCICPGIAPVDDLVRYHLGYHTPHQIVWGFGIGVLFGTILYAAAELLPSAFPNSPLGQVKEFLLDNPVSRFVELRDGWAVYADGGRHEEWVRWRKQWDTRRDQTIRKKSS
jgi:dolichyldiphosphatase